MEDYTSWTWSFYFLSLLLVFTFSFMSHFPFSGFILNLITPYIYKYKTLFQFFWPALEVIVINSEVCFIPNTRRSGLQFVIALTVLLIQFELIFYISFMTYSIETHLPHRRSKKRKPSPNKYLLSLTGIIDT